MQSTINFNMKDSTGTQRFISPKVTITSNKVTKNAPDGLALDLGYIVKAMLDQSFGDVTKTDSGALLLDAVKALPKDAQVSVYMPTQYESRESDDLNKWTKVVTVNKDDLLETCNALVAGSALLKTFKDGLESIANGFKVTGDYTNVSQPVYFTGESGKGKRASAGNKVTSLF